MLTIFPFLAWLATIVSAVLLVVLWRFGELRPWALAVLLAWFVIAAYCEFFSTSAAMGAVGSGLQTLLAIVLILRWRWAV